LLKKEGKARLAKKQVKVYLGLRQAKKEGKAKLIREA